MNVNELVTKGDIQALQADIINRLSEFKAASFIDVQLDTAEVARLCGVSKQTIIKYIDKGLLKPASMQGSRYRIWLSEVNRFRNVVI